MTRLALLVLGLGLAPLTLGLEVARFDGGAVTFGDLVREGRAVSPSELRFRQHLAIPLERTVDDWSQRLALRRLAVRWAATAGVDREPSPRARIRAAQRDLVVSDWSRRGFDRLPPPPDEAELLAEARRRVPVPPDRVLLWHVFQRAATPEASAAARARLEGWRGGIGDRADFEALARRVSDSQSRRRGGALGWCRRGFLPASVEEVLYAWPPGSLAGPLEARGGWHLFWVEKVEVDREPNLELAVAKLRRDAADAAAAAARAEALAAARARFPVEVGDGSWPALRVGEWSLAVGVLETVAPAGVEPAAAVAGVVEGELLLQLALAEGAVDAILRQRLDDLAGQVLHEERLRRSIAGLVREPTEADLAALYEAERERLAAPATLTVEAARVPVPLDRDPLERFDEIAGLVAAADAGELAWPELVAALDGAELFAPGPLPGIRLANLLGPPVLEAVAGSRPGDVVGPVQDAGFLWVVALDQRSERRPLGLDEVRPALREAALDRQAQRLGRELGDRLLAEAGFEYTRLARGLLLHEDR